MSLIQWVMRSFGQPHEQKSTIDLSKWRFAHWPSVNSGVVVNELTALEVATVLAIVRRISTDMAKLAVSVVSVSEEGEKTPQRGNRLYRVLAKRPNRWQTSFEFREMMTAHAVLHGDAVAVKNTVSGVIDELVPLVPGQFAIRQETNWRLTYDVYGPNGEVAMALPQDRVFHLRNLSWNGYKGLNLSRTAREAIGLSAALEGNQATAMQNGSKPTGLLTTDSVLKDDQISRIVEGWKAATTGGKAYSTPLLDGGLKFQPISLTAVDQQLIETRQHQIKEICLAFGVHPAVLGMDGATQAFASVEAMLQDHVDKVAWPWAERWKQALDRDCLDADGPLEVVFDLSEMRKASVKDQAEADVKLVTNGLRTRNELRRRDGLPPLDGGDEPILPMNMTAGSQGDGDAPDSSPV